MPKTVLISLAAVVALIVIVILLGIRYLRADDDDDFDEDVPADHGRNSHDRARRRREHDDMPQDRFNQRQRATAAGRAPAARPAGRAPSRAADDRGWREENGHAAGRGSPPQHDSRPRRSGGRHDSDDISEPAAASTRRGYQGRDRAGARGAEDVDAWPGRSQSASRDYDRDRRSAGQSSHRHDGGRPNGAASDQDELLPAIKPRQSRNKRDTDGDWPSNEWDELSDVDYWAELAADKPLTAPPTAEQAGRPRRGSSRSDASEPALRDGDAGRAGRQPRQRDAALQPDRAIVSTAARKLDPPPADRNEDLLGSGTRRASLGRTEQMHALPPSPGRDSLQPRNPVPPDDDPLTSPSFPRIAADDSRSYRRSKRAAGDESEPGGRARDGSTQPHSYPHPAGLPADNGAGYARTGASAAYIGPGADPYASVPNNGIVPGYPVAQGGSGGYQVPGGQSSGSYPGAGYEGPADFGQNGYQGAGSAPAGNYLPPAATASGGYSGDAVVSGSYQPPAADPASFRSPAADSGNYHTPPVSYPGGGVGGHLPAATSGHPTEFHADQADFASAYPSYSDPRPSAFPQPQPDPGYPPDGYGAGHDPGFHSSLPGHLEAGYPAYQATAAAVNGSPYPYPPAGGQLPGPSAGYQDPYQAAPYDQAGYPSPAAQRGYAGADPYAADPYGYTGYGNGGR